MFYGINAELDYVIYMSVVRFIATVSRNVSCLCLKRRGEFRGYIIMFYGINAELDYVIYMSVVRLIATVSRNVSCLCLIHIYSHCKQMNCWE